MFQKRGQVSYFWSHCRLTSRTTSFNNLHKCKYCLPVKCTSIGNHEAKLCPINPLNDISKTYITLYIIYLFSMFTRSTPAVNLIRHCSRSEENIIYQAAKSFYLSNILLSIVQTIKRIVIRNSHYNWLLLMILVIDWCSYSFIGYLLT